MSRNPVVPNHNRVGPPLERSGHKGPLEVQDGEATLTRA
jgi:hypothetical protein